MHTAKIVVNRIQGDRMAKVIHLFAKGVRQPCKPAHRHPHGQILPLNVAGGNVTSVRAASNDRRLRSNAHRRAVARLWLDGVLRDTIQLNQRGVINLRAKGTFNRIQVNAVAVCGQLDAIRQSAQPDRA